MEVASKQPTHGGQGLPAPNCSPSVEAEEARNLMQHRYDSGRLFVGIEELIARIKRLEKERDEARGIAAFYRGRSCESQEEYDDHKFSWENVKAHTQEGRERDPDNQKD